jgi:hypothetical protein
MLIAV